MCSFHLFELNFQADKDTDEIYAQMTLQPVNSVCAIPFSENLPLLK